MRVAIVDDGDWVREMIVENLKSRGIDVIASVSDSIEILAALAASAVDVAIIDMKMPATKASVGWAPRLGDSESDTYEGLRLATEVKRRWPEIGILILTSFPDLFSARYVDEELQRGRGYWSKDAVSRDDDVLTALTAIQSGDVSFDPRYSEDLERLKSRAIEKLAPRELAVLELMRDGVLAAPAIARKLQVAPGTVKTYKENIYEKLGLRPKRTMSIGRADEATDDDRHGLAIKAVLMLERYLAGPDRVRSRDP